HADRDRHAHGRARPAHRAHGVRAGILSVGSGARGLRRLPPHHPGPPARGIGRADRGNGSATAGEARKVTGEMPSTVLSETMAPRNADAFAPTPAGIDAMNAKTGAYQTAIA